MKRVLCVLALLAAVAFAGNLRLDHVIEVGTDGDLLQYDDGSANWLTWGGLYRGTWFNLGDFGLSGAWQAENSELWFYHHSSFPWDTSSFYCELYQGDQTSPTTQLNQTSVTATHYQPVFANYSPNIDCGGEDFWVLINTELSAGGWPSVLGDDTPNTADHSFFSDDFIVWEPWVIGGSTANDYFIRSEGHTALTSGTWAEIKSLY